MKLKLCLTYLSECVLVADPFVNRVKMSTDRRRQKPLFKLCHEEVFCNSG